MIEQFYGNTDEPVVYSRALERLDENFNAIKRVDGLSYSLYEYVQSEFGNNESQAYAWIESLQLTDSMPQYPYAEDAHDEKDIEVAYRLAFYKSVFPIAQAALSKAEYFQWVSHAVDVVLPRDNEQTHQPDYCIGEFGTDLMCMSGNISCPVRFVRSDIIEQLSKPDFSSIDYAVDKTDTSEQLLILLDAAKRRRLFSQDECTSLENEYIQKYCQAFQREI